MRIFTIIAALAIGLAAQPATAAPLTFSFSGTIGGVPLLDPVDPFAGTIADGTSFTGTFTFESTAADGIADPQTANYSSIGVLYGLIVDIGGNLFTAGDALHIAVTNDLAGPLDQYLVTGVGGDLTITLGFEDTTATIFGGDGLPQTAPALSGFAVRSFVLDDPDVDGNQVQLQGTIDSLACVDCASVPEPATWLLFGTAGIALVRRWRLSQRQSPGIR